MKVKVPKSTHIVFYIDVTEYQIMRYNQYSNTNEPYD